MYQGSVVEVHCPRCRSVAYRVRRRWIDRLTSLFRPARRYRCQEFRCGWEGNVPVAELQALRGTRVSHPPA
jgi:hypothetical protein